MSSLYPWLCSASMTYLYDIPRKLRVPSPGCWVAYIGLWYYRSTATRPFTGTVITVMCVSLHTKCCVDDYVHTPFILFAIRYVNVYAYMSGHVRMTGIGYGHISRNVACADVAALKFIKPNPWCAAELILEWAYVYTHIQTWFCLLFPLFCLLSSNKWHPIGAFHPVSSYQKRTITQ